MGFQIWERHIHKGRSTFWKTFFVSSRVKKAFNSAWDLKDFATSTLKGVWKYCSTFFSHENLFKFAAQGKKNRDSDISPTLHFQRRDFWNIIWSRNKRICHLPYRFTISLSVDIYFLSNRSCISTFSQSLLFMYSNSKPTGYFVANRTNFCFWLIILIIFTWFWL